MKKKTNITLYKSDKMNNLIYLSFNSASKKLVL